MSDEVSVQVETFGDLAVAWASANGERAHYWTFNPEDVRGAAARRVQTPAVAGVELIDRKGARLAIQVHALR